MKTKTKVTVRVTLVLLLVLALSVSAYAIFAPRPQAPIKFGMFYCIPGENQNKLTIVGIDGSEGKYLEIPQTLDGKIVTAIKENAFEKSKSEFFIVQPTLVNVGENGFSSQSGKFAVFLVGRESLDGMMLDTNWNGGGKIIFGAVYPNIDKALQSSNKLTDEDLDKLFSDPNNNNDKNNIFPNIGDADDINNSTDKGGATSNKQPNDKSPEIKDDITIDNGGFVEEGKKEDVNEEIDGNLPQETAKKICTGIVIKKPPTITGYIEGQHFNANGMEITAKYSDGSSEKATGLQFPDEALVAGQTSVQISYNDNEKTFKTQQQIAVAKKQPKSLDIITPPALLSYIEGAKFDPTGLNTVAVYNNGTRKTVKPRFASAALSMGQGSVLLSYEENGKKVKAEQPVIVIKKVPKSLVITKSPDKSKYIEHEIFSLAGIITTVTYNDGDTAIVTNLTFDKTPILYGQKLVTITYEENGTLVSVDCPITVVKRTPTKLSIASPPTKTEYIEGEVFDPTGMVVKVEYDNKKVYVISGYSYSKSKLTFGQTFITLSYEENGATIAVNQPIKVRKKLPTNIVIKTPPTKTEYIEGEVFDPTGMVIEVTYDNGDIAIVNNYKYPKEPVVFEQTVVTLLHEENGSAPVTVNQPITVLPATPNSISIQTPPNQRIYDGGRRFNPDGMVVIGNYKGGTTRIITDYTYPRELLKQGQTAVVISHTSRGVTRTVNCPVTVNEQEAVFEKYTSVKKEEYSDFQEINSPFPLQPLRIL